MSHPSCWKAVKRLITSANLNLSLLLNPRSHTRVYLSSYPSNYYCFSLPKRLSHISHPIQLLRASGLWWQWLEVVCEELMSLACRSRLRNIKKSLGLSTHTWTLSLGRQCTGKSLQKISVKCIPCQNNVTCLYTDWECHLLLHHFFHLLSVMSKDQLLSGYENSIICNTYCPVKFSQTSLFTAANSCGMNSNPSLTRLSLPLWLLMF